MKYLRRKWREAMPEDRAVVWFFGAWIAVALIAALWLGS